MFLLGKKISVFVYKMIFEGKCFYGSGSLLNGNPDIDRVTKWVAIRIHCLPGAFVNTFRKRRREQDAQRCLRPGTGGVQRDLFRSTKRGSADISQAICAVPMAGAAIFHQPLFIQCQPKGGEHIVRNSQIFQKGKIVNAVCRICRWKNCRQGSGFDYHNFLSRLDDKCRFDEWSLSCRWTKGRGG